MARKHTSTVPTAVQHHALVTLMILALLAPAASAQFIYVANAGDDTLSKINITTNQIVATYRTWFGPSSQPGFITHPPSGTLPLSPWAGPAPSRIAVDSFGNVYVLNRFFYQPNFFSAPPSNAPFPAAHLPVLLKILPMGGVPGVTTSNSSIALPMADTNGDSEINCPLSASPACNASGPNEITDQRIAWAVEVGNPGNSTNVEDRGSLGRALCIDPSGNLWVGMYHTMRYYKVNSVTGATIGGPVSTGPSHKPYSCRVDPKGKLWSVDEGHTLAEIDTTATLPVATIHNHASQGENYSVSLLNACGTNTRVYLPEHENPPGTGRTSIVYDPATGTFSNPPLPNTAKFNSVAIGIDSQGSVLSGEYRITGRVIKYNPTTNTLLWDTGVNSVQTKDLHGIIIDAHDDVWAVHLDGDRVVKYSGANGQVLATVTGLHAPYTYSNVPPATCPCAAVGESHIGCTGQNAGVATYSWSFTFTNNSPFTAPVTEITLSSSQVGNLTPSTIHFSNPVPQNGQATVSGTFTVQNPQPGATVCLDIRLFAGEWCCPTQQVCFRLPECRDCAKLQGEFTCQPNGAWGLALTVTNNGSSAAQSVQVFSNTPGVTVSPLMTVQAFPQGVPVVVPLTVTGATAGQPITLTVNLHGPTNPETGMYSWCCTATITVTFPKTSCG